MSVTRREIVRSGPRRAGMLLLHGRTPTFLTLPFCIDSLRISRQRFRSGASGIMRILLEREPELEAVNAIGTTPLWLSSGYGHVEVLDQLINAGAKVGPTRDACEARRSAHLRAVRHAGEPSGRRWTTRRRALSVAGRRSPG
jgi:hypothetical protein